MSMHSYDLFREVTAINVILIVLSESTYEEQAQGVISELAKILKNVVVRSTKCTTVCKDLIKFKI